MRFRCLIAANNDGDNDDDDDNARMRNVFTSVTIHAMGK